jgi:solute carrier family 9B (sodium/hydrogen exchanger), member 1/2
LLFSGIAYGLFDMPIVFCFAMGYIVSCISPSVMVPGLITLVQKGYGVERGVCGSLIAAGTFDDIVCIILFGVCKTVGYNEYGMSSGKSMDEAIGMLFTEFFIGLAVGIVMGLSCYFFKYLNGFRY